MDIPTKTTDGLRFGRMRRLTGQGFQLDEHPHAIAAVVFFAVLAVYAVVDIFLTADTGYVSSAPYWLFVLCGLAAAGACYLWLHRGSVPRAEAAGLAAITGIALACALYPGLLRISDVVAAGHYQPHDYRLTKNRMMRPVEPSLPTFAAPLDRGYWRQQANGSQWTFEMRRGLFGLWLYRIKPLREQIDGFYLRQEIRKHLQPTKLHSSKK